MSALLGACGGSSGLGAGDSGAGDGGPRESDGGSEVNEKDGSGDLRDASGASGEEDGGTPKDGGGLEEDAGDPPRDAGMEPEPCRTRVTYGASWIHPPGHPANHDDVAAEIRWDGSCEVDAAGNAVATLSNGWTPTFQGKRCVIALDYTGDCPAAPGGCSTRISYGPTWLRAPGHPADHDDVAARVTWDGVCRAAGGDSFAQLSNGWTPYFSGAAACDLALRYQQCGGLYRNPVLGEDCPDPGVLKDGSTYYMVCTQGARGLYPIWSSSDLVSWRFEGRVFENANKPSWAASDFWAPEIHRVDGKYVVYFSARATTGTFAVGAAWSTSPTGPFVDVGAPLVAPPSPGAIDAHYFRASGGAHYLLWKVDGNAVGQSTPIRIQPLAPNGLSLTGSPSTILSNTLAWEGALVEGPFMVERGGSYYLFYSGNGYGSPAYGVSVARASQPTGPFIKLGHKILASSPRWAGPGHGSIVEAPAGGFVHVYHSWVAGNVNQSPGRLVLVDPVQWSDGWPLMRTAPSYHSQPKP